MSVHAQHQQANTGCSLLCVWCDTTHYVNNKTGRTRVQHTTQRSTNDHTHQGIQLSTQAMRRPLLLASCADNTASQLEAWSQPNSRGNNSKNITSHTDTNRHGDPSQQELSVDIQQPRLLGKNPQNTTQCIVHARQQTSSSNRKVGELQKNSHTETKQQHRSHWRSIPRPRQEATEKDHTRKQLDSRNMVQSEKGNTPSMQHTTTTSTSTSQRANTNNVSTTHSRSTTSTNVSTQCEEASHWGETNRPSNDHDTATPTSNSISKGSQSNTGLLDQRRSILETCTCPTKTGHVHSTTNKWWTRRDKTDNMETNNGEANKWQQRIQNQWWLDNKEESNTRHRVVRLNKLWGEHGIQRQVHHRWSRGATRSKESNRSSNTTTTNRTSTKRTWTDTPSLQKLVSNMRTKQRKTRQPPKANKQNTSDPSGSDVLQSIRKETNNISPHSSGRWNRHVHGSPTWGQDTTRAIPVILPTKIPDGMWQNTCSSQQHRSSIRPRRLYHLLAQDDGNSDGQQHSSEASTSLHITSTRKRRTFPQNIDGPSQSHQTPTGDQLWHQAQQQASHHAVACETLSIPYQQVLHPLKWKHKLLQTMGQRTQSTNLWVWWNSSLHVTNSKTYAKDGSKVLSGHLVG